MKTERTRLQQLAPWALCVLGLAMIALAVIGLGLSLGSDPGIGAVMVNLTGAGIAVMIAGLILALIQAGPGEVRWLIGSALALMCIGTGPLMINILSARLGLTATPNLGFDGLLIGVTFVPAIALLICSFVANADHGAASATPSHG
jgi:hypothetical protein